jgi:hypothetical protein
VYALFNYPHALAGTRPRLRSRELTFDSDREHDPGGADPDVGYDHQKDTTTHHPFSGSSILHQQHSTRQTRWMRTGAGSRRCTLRSYVRVDADAGPDGGSNTDASDEVEVGVG